MTVRSEVGGKADSEGLARGDARGALAGVRLVPARDGGGGQRPGEERRSADERRRAAAYGRARGRLS